jgi:hypothetical protein
MYLQDIHVELGRLKELIRDLQRDNWHPSLTQGKKMKE